MILGTGVPFTAEQIAWPNFSPGYYPIRGSLQGPPFVIDQNGGRPARMYQWSLGVQREVMRNLVVEANYVGNRGIWWPPAAPVIYNAIKPETLRSYGLDLNLAADRTILNAPLSSAAAGRFQNRFPYTGFRATATVAQSLRPFPQFNAALAPQRPHPASIRGW